jgi:predicted O-methyltransferase YrrM
MNDAAQGIDLLKAKVGFGSLYDGVPPVETTRHFFNGAEVFDRLIETVRPRLIVEVGTWMGHSAIHMSKSAARFEPGALTICVDTWLGSSEHYFNDKHLGYLALRNGRPTFYDNFLSNVAFHGLQDRILPLSIASRAGFEILQQLNLKADLIYIDAGHGYDDVRGDLRDYRKLLSASGVIFGDDYFYPPVKRAVDDYARNHDLHVASYGDRGQKWVLVGSREDADRLMGDLPLAAFV